MVVKCAFTVVDLAVTVEVKELEVTGISAEVGTVLMVRVCSSSICLSIVSEDTGCAETPDFSEFLA